MPSFSDSLETAIQSALKLAAERKHEFATLEHLLLALSDEPDANRVMKACAVDVGALISRLTDFVNLDLSNLETGNPEEPSPTASFQRVIQRAAIHVQSSGRSEVSGANVLVAIFAERESQACYFLQEQGTSRYDVVNYIAHGVAKDPAYNKTRPIEDFEESEVLVTEESSFEANKFDGHGSAVLRQQVTFLLQTAPSSAHVANYAATQIDRSICEARLNDPEEAQLFTKFAEALRTLSLAIEDGAENENEIDKLELIIEQQREEIERLTKLLCEQPSQKSQVMVGALGGAGAVAITSAVGYIFGPSGGAIVEGFQAFFQSGSGGNWLQSSGTFPRG